MIVLLMGCPYKFTKRAWKNFLIAWDETGEMPPIEKYATLIATFTINITDLGIEDVRAYREEYVK